MPKKYLILAFALVIGNSCSQNKTETIEDISVSNSDLIDGMDEKLQQEIADYAFLDPKVDSLIQDSIRKGTVVADSL